MRLHLDRGKRILSNPWDIASKEEETEFVSSGSNLAADAGLGVNWRGTKLLEKKLV